MKAPNPCRYSDDAQRVFEHAARARLQTPPRASQPRGGSVDPAKGELTEPEVLHSPPKIVRTLTIEFDDDVAADAVLNMLTHVQGVKVTIGNAGGA